MAEYSGAGAGSFGALGGSISFEFVPDPEEIAASLMDVAGYLEDIAGPLAISRTIAIEDIRLRFDTQTGPDGNSWVPWSDSYRPDAEQNNIGGILERTGDLRNAATSEDAFIVDGDSLFYDTSGLPPYGFWNETGATRSGRGFEISDEDISHAAKTLGKSVEEIKKAFGSGSSGDNVLPARPFMGVSFEAELRIVEVFDQWFDGAIALGISSKGKAFGRYNVRNAAGRFTSSG